MTPAATPSPQHLLESMRLAVNEKDAAAFSLALERAIQNSTLESPERLKTFIQAGETLYQKGCHAEARRWLELGTEEARQANQKGGQALALGLLADLERTQGNYRNALSRLTQARQILGEYPAHDKDISAQLHIISGLNYISLGEYHNAREAFYEAYQTYNQLNDLKGKALAANRLGTVAMMEANYSEAEKYLRESLEVSKQLNDHHGMAGALMNLGEIQRIQQAFPAACVSYAQASALFAQLGSQRGVCIAENNLGHIAAELRDYPTSKQHYLSALECARIANLLPDKLDTLAGLALICVQRNLLDDAARLAQFILLHPAHLQETEKFLEPAQRVSASKDASPSGEIPPPSQLDQVIAETLVKLFP